MPRPALRMRAPHGPVRRARPRRRPGGKVGHRLRGVTRPPRRRLQGARRRNRRHRNDHARTLRRPWQRDRSKRRRRRKSRSRRRLFPNLRRAHRRLRRPRHRRRHHLLRRPIHRRRASWHRQARRLAWADVKPARAELELAPEHRAAPLVAAEMVGRRARASRQPARPEQATASIFARTTICSAGTSVKRSSIRPRSGGAGSPGRSRSRSQFALTGRSAT